MKTFLMTVAFAAACLLGVGIGRFSYSEELPTPELSAQIPTQATASSEIIPDKESMSVAEACIASVVHVSAGQDDRLSRSCGMILSEDGFILTSLHLLEDEKPIYVTLADKTQCSAHLMWKEEALDLAILKIRKSNLQAVSLSEAETLPLGAPVLAAGMDGALSPTVTCGILSGKNLALPEETADGKLLYTDGFFKTDAAFNGNTCDFLLDAQGNLIGIRTEAFGNAQSTPPAIPADIFRPVISAFLQSGTFHCTDFGFSCKKQMPQDTELCITTIKSHSPADRAGLKKGDILLSIDETTPPSTLALHRLIFSTPSGKILSVSYQRNGITYRTELILSEEDERTEA